MTIIGGIDLIIRNGRIGETYNIGGNNEQANINLIHALCEVLDAHFPESPNVPHQQHITYVTDRPGHDRRYAIDNRKLSYELGCIPQETFQTGLKKIVEWYMKTDNILIANIKNPVITHYRSQQ